MDIQVCFHISESNDVAICDFLAYGAVFIPRLDNVADGLRALLHQHEQIVLLVVLCNCL